MTIPSLHRGSLPFLTHLRGDMDTKVCVQKEGGRQYLGVAKFRFTDLVVSIANKFGALRGFAPVQKHLEKIDARSAEALGFLKQQVADEYGTEVLTKLENRMNYDGKPLMIKHVKLVSKILHEPEFRQAAIKHAEGLRAASQPLPSQESSSADNVELRGQHTSIEDRAENAFTIYEDPWDSPESKTKKSYDAALLKMEAAFDVGMSKLKAQYDAELSKQGNQLSSEPKGADADAAPTVSTPSSPESKRTVFSDLIPPPLPAKRHAETAETAPSEAPPLPPKRTAPPLPAKPHAKTAETAPSDPPPLPTKQTAPPLPAKPHAKTAETAPSEPPPLPTKQTAPPLPAKPHAETVETVETAPSEAPPLPPKRPTPPIPAKHSVQGG